MDSLPDTPLFEFSLEGKSTTVAEEKIDAYMGSDSVIVIYARTGDTSGIFISIPVKGKAPFSVPTGYSSHNTKIAFSEEFAVLPTVILSNYPETDVSFNNLDDGFNKREIQPGAMMIYELKKKEGVDTLLVKGHIRTTLLKNVYSNNKPYNHDYEISGRFVVRFRSHLDFNF